MAAVDIKHDVDDLERNSSGTENQKMEPDTTVSALVDPAGYHRKLGKRQIMMMTFGAGIGTGLWVGTGTALKYGMSRCHTECYEK